MLLLNPAIATDISQMWYADDASAGHSWWDHVICLGPDFGHFPNAAKACLIVKPQHLCRALERERDVSCWLTTLS